MIYMRGYENDTRILTVILPNLVGANNIRLVRNHVTPILTIIITFIPWLLMRNKLFLLLRTIFYLFLY